MLVEVWSDVVCPWCYIGKRRFAAATYELAADPEFDTTIDVVYRPFQLDPKAPPGSTMPVTEAYARKFGGPERAAVIIENISRTAAAEGLEFHLDRAQRANTRDAHRLLAAYFTDGADVGVDSDQGLPELADALTFAAEAGITAVPTYVIDDRWSIPWAQDPGVFVQVLRRLTANDGAA